MAKKRAKKRTGKRASKKRRTGKKRATKVSSAARKKAIAQRTRMHKLASELADFHGGRLPVKSGCGRPRKR